MSSNPNPFCQVSLTETSFPFNIYQCTGKYVMRLNSKIKSVKVLFWLLSANVII